MCVYSVFRYPRPASGYTVPFFILRQVTSLIGSFISSGIASSTLSPPGRKLTSLKLGGVGLYGQGAVRTEEGSKGGRCVGVSHSENSGHVAFFSSKCSDEPCRKKKISWKNKASDTKFIAFLLTNQQEIEYDKDKDSTSPTVSSTLTIIYVQGKVQLPYVSCTRASVPIYQVEASRRSGGQAVHLLMPQVDTEI